MGAATLQKHLWKPANMKAYTLSISHRTEQVQLHGCVQTHQSVWKSTYINLINVPQ